MIQSYLQLDEVMGSIQSLVDSVWLISLGSGKIVIIKDSMMPAWEGEEWDYYDFCYSNIKPLIDPADWIQWENKVSLPSLRKSAALSCLQKNFDIRFCNEVFGFETHEVFLNGLTDPTGDCKEVLILRRNANLFRKADIIERAVETEYDYVVYIEAEKNSYVMYSANHEKDTMVPPVASSNYEFEVSEFHCKYVPEEERESLTERLSIRYVQPILERDGEYVTYCKVMENDLYRDKKLRFSYYDREQNIWLLTRTDITEIREEKRQKKLLQDALNAATVANQAKSEFLSRMSHDIRTPMNAIIGMASIASIHIDNRERVLNCLAKITDSSKLLLALINEVLDMSKVESGNIVLSEEEINLAELVQSVVAMMQPAIDEKSLSFDARVNGVRNENVIGDMQRLQQVLLNLLSNAVKYTPECGYILLEVSEKPSGKKDEGCFEFMVADSGIGMKREFMEKIFEPFERADDAFVHSVQGTGLGMAISKNVVEMMDGDIRVESLYGKGSKFTATVYLRLREETTPDPKLFAGLSVLVVDDDEVVCRNTCEQLNELGMESQWVRNGRDAVVEAAKAHEKGKDFFTIIIDLRMPGMDGIETTRKIRARVGPDIPIVIVSAYDWNEYEEEARKAGADGFIMKPLFCSRLVCQLKRFTGREPEPKAVLGQTAIQKDFTGKRILLVEDNELNREIAQELLSLIGAVVETAEDGNAAVGKVAASPERYYDLIFMDMQMPVMNGCQAALAIRALHRKDVRTLPIIAMTANAFAEDIKKTKSAGMNEHMAKPIDMDTLVRTLHRWLDPPLP